MKKPGLISFIAFFCCFTLQVKSQEYSFKHYGIRDGLVGNHVYDAAKDSTGFLWFATETGVSRFDGTTFKNFTTGEGLPDNEILKLFVDSKGRVWMMPFKKAICYYYKGKIYNSSNDTLLRKLKIEDHIENMLEDEKGNLVFKERLSVVVLPGSSHFFLYNDFANGNDLVAAGGLKDKSPIIIHRDSFFYKLIIGPASTSFQKMDMNIHFWPFKISSFNLNSHVTVYINNYNNVFETHSVIVNDAFRKTSDTVNLHTQINSLFFVNDSIIILNTQKGAIEYNVLKRKITGNYLENENVSCSLKDDESNLWFTTLRQGIFKLPSGGNKNVFFSDDPRQRKPVESIVATTDNVIAGSDDETVYVFNRKSGIIKTIELAQTLGRGQVINIKKHDGQVYILTEGCMQKADSAFKNVKVFYNLEIGWSYKDFDFDKNNRIFLSTHIESFFIPAEKDSAVNYFDQDKSYKKKYSNKATLLQKRRLSVNANSFFFERATSICCTDSGIYLGTLEGLRFIDWDKKVTDLRNKFPSINGRITELLVSGNKLWIGTNDQGVFCIDNRKILANISVKNGLTGNLVRTLWADNKYVWVGTDRGLNKIGLADKDFPVLQTYSTTDGLTSDMINSVYSDGDTVYIGTPEGLSFFNEKSLKSNSICNLQVLGIVVSGRMQPFDSSKLILKNTDNNIRIDFVAISYKSEGNIVYWYKLSGIDSAWNTTRNNFLQYPTLPSGNYRMELYAVNKFGVKSPVVMINFEITKKLVEKSWFIILVVLLFILIAWLFANGQIQRIKKSQKEKLLNAEKIAVLEQQALKTQMNPHFIFNCLNSIQQYVIDKDIRGANKFISEFSKLIRQTLDNSGKQSITVGEEESYLRSYLELEKSRFEDKFDFAINIDGEIDKNEDSLPPMLLQPYVENCIRHGIMHKKDGAGKILVEFNLSDHNLICMITDNGIGRAAADLFKGMQHKSYQSKGTEVTGQRIKMINKNNNAAIILSIDDLFEVNGKACGTKVTIVIPLQKMS